MAKKGGDWKYIIYFDPESDKKNGPSYEIEDDELISELSKLVDADEKIRKVEAFKSPLIPVQLTKLLLYHEFIVFETKKYWWSIEKQKDGITLQRSTQKNAVVNIHRKADREGGLSGIAEMKSAPGKKSITELIAWLYFSNELNKKYHFLESNCQGFAESIYKFMT